MHGRTHRHVYVHKCEYGVGLMPLGLGRVAGAVVPVSWENCWGCCPLVLRYCYSCYDIVIVIAMLLQRYCYAIAIVGIAIDMFYHYHD